MGLLRDFMVGHNPFFFAFLFLSNPAVRPILISSFPGARSISQGAWVLPATYEISIPSPCRACWSLKIYGYSTILHTLLMGVSPQCLAQATTANAFTTFEKFKTVFISSSRLAMNMVKKQSRLLFPIYHFPPNTNSASVDWIHGLGVSLRHMCLIELRLLIARGNGWEG